MCQQKTTTSYVKIVFRLVSCHTHSLTHTTQKRSLSTSVSLFLARSLYFSLHESVYLSQQGHHFRGDLNDHKADISFHFSLSKREVFLLLSHKRHLFLLLSLSFSRAFSLLLFPYENIYLSQQGHQFAVI